MLSETGNLVAPSHEGARIEMYLTWTNNTISTRSPPHTRGRGLKSVRRVGDRDLCTSPPHTRGRGLKSVSEVLTDAPIASPPHTRGRGLKSGAHALSAVATVVAPSHEGARIEIRHEKGPLSAKTSPPHTRGRGLKS